MTTTSGTYMFCDADSSFSMAINCAGPNCSKLIGNSNLTCTQTGSDSWQCTNGVNCDSASGFTSKFSIVETNTTVLQTQNVSINSTTFTFQQDGAGDVTLSNTTSTISSSELSKATTSSISSTSMPSTASVPSTTSLQSTTPSVTASITLSPSTTSRTSSASTRQSYSTVLVLTMLALSLFLTQAQAGSIWTGNDISASVGYIFDQFNVGKDAGSLYQIAGNVIAGEFEQVVISTCGALVSEGVGNIVGLPLAYGQCEEAMVGAEMSAIGSELGLTLRTYAGLGGVLTTALTAADEAAVLAADASAIPEVFIINSVLCGLLLAVIEQAALDPASENLCSALVNAASNHKPNPASTSSTTSTTSITSTSTTTISSSTTPSALSSSPSPSPLSSLPIPSIAPDSCASCQLSVYALGIQGLAAGCNVAVPLGTASDLSILLCDSSYNGLYNQFCATFCANPCATYSIDSWIQSAGSQFMPSDTLATCNNLCPGFEGDGRCSSSIDSCSCGVGSDTCVSC